MYAVMGGRGMSDTHQLDALRVFVPMQSAAVSGTRVRGCYLSGGYHLGLVRIESSRKFEGEA